MRWPRLVRSIRLLGAVTLLTACSDLKCSQLFARDELADAGPPKPTTVAETTIAETPSGKIRGQLAGALQIFRGIPYAPPPVGELRFRPSDPLGEIEGTFDARLFGEPCPQLADPNARARDDAKVIGDENCLTLNVWAPVSTRPVPVLLFVHGGELQVGRSSDPMYDGTALARSGQIVVVTFNYRLGALGFLATKKLAEEAAGRAGNYGLSDQIAALKWIKTNIAALGGDPDNVTVFGAAAGALATCALASSPVARGLFRRAILHDAGSCDALPGLDQASRAHPAAFELGKTIAKAAGCLDKKSENTCLRKLAPDALVRAGATAARSPLGLTAFTPVLDGYILKRNPLPVLREGKHEITFVVGSSANASSLFVPDALVTSKTAYKRKMAELFGPAKAKRLLGIYRPKLFGRPKNAYLRALTEIRLICPSLALARAAAAPTHPSYVYYFAHAPGGLLGRLAGSHRGVEIASVFGTHPAGHTSREGADDVRRLTQDAWASFVRDGAPKIQTDWPAYEADLPTLLSMDVKPSLISDPTDGRCNELRAAGVLP